MKAHVAHHPLRLAAHAITDLHVREVQRVGGLRRRGESVGLDVGAHEASRAVSMELAIMLTPITSDAIASASNSTSHQ